MTKNERKIFNCVTTPKYGREGSDKNKRQPVLLDPYVLYQPRRVSERIECQRVQGKYLRDESVVHGDSTGQVKGRKVNLFPARVGRSSWPISAQLLVDFPQNSDVFLYSMKNKASASLQVCTGFTHSKFDLCEFCGVRCSVPDRTEVRRLPFSNQPVIRSS
eukprot:g81525.t1